MKEDRLVEASYLSNIPGVLGDHTLLVVTGELHKRLRGTLLNLFAGIKAQNSFFLAHIEENAVQVMLSWATKKTVYKGFKIPVGWKILLVFSGVYLDPSWYSNPEEFNPWRWQADDTRDYFRPQ